MMHGALVRILLDHGVRLGSNVATYKFALGKPLIEFGQEEHEAVSLEELSVPFARHLCNHLAEVETQGTFPRSRFLDTCRFYNAGEIGHDELITATSMLGFVNVINAFHRKEAVVDGPPRRPVDGIRNACGRSMSLCLLLDSELP